MISGVENNHREDPNVFKIRYRWIVNDLLHVTQQILNQRCESYISFTMFYNIVCTLQKHNNNYYITYIITT